MAATKGTSTSWGAPSSAYSTFTITPSPFTACPAATHDSPLSSMVIFRTAGGASGRVTVSVIPITIEAGLTILALREGIVPPTINLTHPDPDCDLDYVPLEARRAPIRVALSNAFGFGGANTALVLRRWDGD